ncbi:MAG: FecR domain-containing protein [Mediterranea sp.]|jgi:ferric-dicitrate binding protein FerR (iron transport regulator)|nr:FecR domain-containing protein [Mediterranea sp.]
MKDELNLKEALRRDTLTDEETARLWQRVDPANVAARRRKRRRALVLSLSAVAAAACVVGVLFLTRTMASGPKPDAILAFVQQVDTADYSASNTQLVLSADQTVELTERESTVTYDSASIKLEGGKRKEVKADEAARYNRLIVPMGKRSTLALADGSRVWVNAGTQVIYPVTFAADRRELYVDGEIYLSVTPDKDRPFVVKTKETDIVVTGTEFNVSAYDSEAEQRVVLVRGGVEVTNRGDGKRVPSTFTLAPGEMYWHDARTEAVRAVDVARYVSWKEGMYIFDNDRLSYILTRLARYYGEPIRWDKAAGEQRCSGKLDLKGSLDEVLQGLTITAPIAYEHAPDHHSITIRMSNP